MLHFDIFGDAYAAYLSAPKTEPGDKNTDSQLTVENWNITNVHTIGTAIKEENADSILRIDPNCVIHRKDSELNTDLLQEATPCRMDTFQEATPCENVTSLQSDLLQEAPPGVVPYSTTSQESSISYKHPITVG